MGESLSSKLTTSCCHAPGSIALHVRACRICLLRVPEGATADGEGQGSTGAGEEMEAG